MKTNAFITGSHAYGTPRAGSDIDLVVFMDDQQFELLSLCAPPEAWVSDESGQPYLHGSACLRFGSLNLIVLRSEPLYEAWKAGTEELIVEKPVTRDRAIEVLKDKRDTVEAARAAAAQEASELLGLL